jgi:hypothetical protein
MRVRWSGALHLHAGRRRRSRMSDRASECSLDSSWRRSGKLFALLFHVKHCQPAGPHYRTRPFPKRIMQRAGKRLTEQGKLHEADRTRSSPASPRPWLPLAARGSPWLSVALRGSPWLSAAHPNASCAPPQLRGGAVQQPSHFLLGDSKGHLRTCAPHAASLSMRGKSAKCSILNRPEAPVGL